MTAICIAFLDMWKERVLCWPHFRCHFSCTVHYTPSPQSTVSLSTAEELISRSRRMEERKHEEERLTSLQASTFPPQDSS